MSLIPVKNEQITISPMPASLSPPLHPAYTPPELLLMRGGHSITTLAQAAGTSEVVRSVKENHTL